MLPRLRNGALAPVLTVGLILAAAGVRADEPNLEYEVKAAFLYNFTKFVEWPDTAFAAADSPLVFCIVGNNPFDGSLERVISDRTANGRRIEVRESGDSASLTKCHLAFFPKTEDDSVARVVQSVAVQQRAPVLTVGESERFANANGIIRLTVEQGRVRFDINARASEHVGLKLSSQLLKLARSVVK